FFTSLDKLITLHQRKLKKLKETKSAYLSEMFPKEGKKYPQRRFASFTDPWEQRKLGELNFTISDGNYGELYPKSNELLSEGVPFIRVNNIINGYLVHKDLVYISPKLHAVLKSGHLKEDDILITTRGEIGKIALVDNRFEDANINAQICLIRTDNKMESRYLHQYLQTDFSQKEIISFQTGSALKQLPKNRLDDITIVYPIQKEEQVKVGAFFEKLDNLITLHQHKLEKLKNIKKAYLNEMFV
ncbi:MAG: restriction endonuclease subunit S, partial [Tissierella sp.]